MVFCLECALRYVEKHKSCRGLKMMYRYDEVSQFHHGLVQFSLSTAGGDIRQGCTVAESRLMRALQWQKHYTIHTHYTLACCCIIFISKLFLLCLSHTGANQHFGETGVRSGHVKERKRRRQRSSYRYWRRRRRRRRRWGHLPWLKPCQSIASQARPPETCHCGSVPGTSVL